jgi:hypothetical protein
MKKILAVLATAIALSAPAFAQAAPALDPAVVDAVRQMQAAMHLREVMTASLQQMEQTMPQNMRNSMTQMINASTRLDAAQKQQQLAQMEKNLPALTRDMHELFSDPTLIDDMLAEVTPLYAQTYTVDEINQMSAFYQSPVGQKMLATMPKLMAESMAISQRVMTPRIQKVMARTAHAVTGK